MRLQHSPMTARQSLVLLLEALLLTSTIYARGLDETAVADMSIGAAPGSRQMVSLASDGDGFFAVWTDSRDEELAIRGARFDAAGNGLDPIDFKIATVHTLAAHAAVAW